MPRSSAPRGRATLPLAVTVALAGLPTALWAQSPGQAPDPLGILEETAARYEEIDGFCADFEQVRVVPLLSQTTRSRGTLCQRDPGFFRMDFSDPEGDLVVSDGEVVWTYYPSVNPGQVIRSAIGGPGGRTFDFHREFLDDPAGRFDVTYERPDAVEGRPAHVLSLRPRSAGASYERARIWVEAGRGLIGKVEIVEENGSRRTLALSDVRIDPGLDPSRFEFTPPEGARVIRRGPPRSSG